MTSVNRHTRSSSKNFPWLANYDSENNYADYDSEKNYQGLDSQHYNKQIFNNEQYT